MSSISASRHLLFWSLAAIGLAADLGTKAWMFSRQDLLAGQTKWIWTNHVGFQLSLNQGALFGMGQGNVWLFAACSIAAAIAIPTWLFVFGGAHDRALTIVLGCILGGVIGNLYDRVGLPGLEWDTLEHLNYNQNPPGRVYAVRDFVLLARQWPPRSRWDVWPNFNLADSLLVCGAIALLVLSMRKPSAETTAPASSGATVGR
jgi:signal peptidase II